MMLSVDGRPKLRLFCSSLGTHELQAWPRHKRANNNSGRFGTTALPEGGMAWEGRHMRPGAPQAAWESIVPSVCCSQAFEVECFGGPCSCRGPPPDCLRLSDRVCGVLAHVPAHGARSLKQAVFRPRAPPSLQVDCCGRHAGPSSVRSLSS